LLCIIWVEKDERPKRMERKHNCRIP
jgi:hypothetical protein